MNEARASDASPDEEGHERPGGTTRLARTSRERQRSQRAQRPQWWARERLPESAFASSARAVDLERPRSSPWVWLAVGLVSALVGQACGWFFFTHAGAWNGALLFTLCGLGAYIYPIFKRNTEDIWSGRERPARANRLLARDLASLFAGILLGYAAVPAVIGTATHIEHFPHLADLLGAHRAAVHDHGFADAFALSLHNLRVAAAFFLISMLFRYLGLLFVVIYNAALWGVIGVDLISGSAGAWSGGWLGGVAVTLALLPHTLVELTAYVTAAMAGVFTSRCVTRYRIGSVAFVFVARGILRIIAVATLLVLVAAAIESLVANRLVQLLSAEDERLPVPHDHFEDSGAAP